MLDLVPTGLRDPLGSSDIRPEIKSLESPTYKLALFLVPILKSSTGNEYTSKESFAFVEETFEQDSGVFMGSLAEIVKAHLKRTLTWQIHFLKILKEFVKNRI